MSHTQCDYSGEKSQFHNLANVDHSVPQFSQCVKYWYTLGRRRKPRASKESQYNYLPPSDHIEELEKYHTVDSLPHCGHKTKLSLSHTVVTRQSYPIVLNNATHCGWLHAESQTIMYHTIHIMMFHLVTTLKNWNSILLLTLHCGHKTKLSLVLNNATHCGGLHADS